MEKKKVTKRIQSYRHTPNRRINSILNAMKHGRVLSKDAGESENETVYTEQEPEPSFKKREKRQKKQQPEEITDQIPEENVQQQGEIGENQ